MTDASSSEVGRVIAHYLVERVLGRGSAGIVYLARDQRINRLVALKSIDVASQRFEDARDADEFFQRLQREVEVCGGLNHPNLVTLYDAGYEEGRVSWLALEYVDGNSLLELMRAARPDPLPIGRTFAIALDVLRGLAYAHEKGIVHRDIKPANILVSAEGVAKIADFGIARPAESLMTVTGTLMGTPNYMSPEQVKGQTATARSDLFSFGGMLYEMLSTRKAFGASDISGVLYNIVHREHARLEGPEVTGELADLVDRLLAKSPDARPSDAREVLDALRKIAVDAAAIPAAVEVSDTEVTEKTDLSPSPAALPARTRRRDVSPAVARGIIATMGVALLLTIIALAVQIDPSPTVSIPEETLKEFAEKRASLQAAENLCSQGKLDDCIAAYDAYLERYPWARAAKDSRAEAARLKQEARRGGTTVESTKGAWQRFKGRVKGVFRND
ncbi:MAG: serine/threonine-protein kinase [Thermoanaerobaculia bacterium]